MPGSSYRGAPEADVWADQGEQWADEEGRRFVVVEARPDPRMQPQSYQSRSRQQGWQPEQPGAVHARQQMLQEPHAHQQHYGQQLQQLLPQAQPMLPRHFAEDMDEAAVYSLNDGQLRAYDEPYAGQGWEASEQEVHGSEHLQWEQQQQQQVGPAAGAAAIFGGGRVQPGQRQHWQEPPKMARRQYCAPQQQGGWRQAPDRQEADVDEFGVSLDAAGGAFGKGEADAVFLAEGHSAAWAEGQPDMAGG
jgi:hypothetical protein